MTRENDRDGATIDPLLDLNYINAATPRSTLHEILVPAPNGLDSACGTGSVMEIDTPGSAFARSAP